MLIAQARAEELTLIGVDDCFPLYEVEILALI
jgi:PIN domain nuclease of toxin-antitoxin system